MVSELRAEAGHGEVGHNEDLHNSMHDSPSCSVKVENDSVACKQSTRIC